MSVKEKGVVTSKTFSQTVYICYALGGGKVLFFGNTMDNIWLSTSRYLDNLICHTSVLTSTNGESSANEDSHNGHDVILQSCYRCQLFHRGEYVGEYDD
ncbi:hypothetical protein TNCV_458061 [Trichonephila clavipes]|nr:hypothetical protein TNCV_458061 [Trichonephila clavipes]